MNLQESMRRINEINQNRKIKEQELDATFESILKESVPANRIEEEGNA